MSTRTQTQAKAAPKPAFTPVQGGLLQRKCACGRTAGLIGECAECSKKKRFSLQTKLKVNKLGDSYEQEADRIADQILVTPAHHAVSDAPPRIQRFSAQWSGQMDAAPASVDQALASPGRALEPALRQDMEQRFGHDFSRVRVHSGAAAEQSAQDINAHAYTIGRNIVFGAGQFAPGTHEGRRLLAHELAHVVQQTGHGVTAIQRKEKETDGSWLALAAAAERLSMASLSLYKVDRGDKPLLEIIEPESLLSAGGTRQAVETKVARPMGGQSEKIESPFTNYIDLQETLRTFETSLVSHLRYEASEVLDTTETKLKHMYALYVGKGPHLDWRQNLDEGYPQKGPGWLKRHIDEVKENREVIKLGEEYKEFKRAMDREQEQDDKPLHYFERKRKLQKAQQQYNKSLRQVLTKKSPLFFLPGFDVGSFLDEKSSEVAQNKLIRFIQDSGLKVRKARKKLGDRRFLYKADILLNSVKEGLAKRLGQDPEFNRSVIGEDPTLGPLAREAKLSRRVETLNFIVDELARERKSESTLWEDIVKVLEVLSTFVPGPIGWGIRQGVAAASFDIKMGRAEEQSLLYGNELSAVAPDPNAASSALGEAALQVVPDVPVSLGAKGAKPVIQGVEKNLERSTVSEAADLGERELANVGERELANAPPKPVSPDPLPQGVPPTPSMQPVKPPTETPPPKPTPTQKPVITAHADPSGVVLHEVKPPAKVEGVPPLASGSLPAPDMPKGTVADVAKRGRRIKVAPDSPTSAPKTTTVKKRGGKKESRPPTTAAPKSEPQPLEGYGDAFEQTGMSNNPARLGAPPLESGIKGDIGEARHAAEVSARMPVRAEKHFSEAELLKERDALLRGDITLREFAENYPPEGVAQLFFPTARGGGRVVDHVYVEANTMFVVFRESKNYELFKLGAKELKQLKKDLAFLTHKRFKGLRIEWRISGKVSPETIKTLDDLVETWKGRFSYVLD